MAYRRPPRDIETMTSLRVGNLPFQTQSDDLRILFGKYGDIGDIFMPMDRNTGRPRGFAFVRYPDKRDAEEALDALNGRTFDGRDMRISVDEGRPGGNRGGYRGGGGDRYGDRRGDRRDRSRSRSRGRRSRSNDRRDRRDRSGDRRDRSRDRSGDRKDKSRDRSGDRRDKSRDRSGSNDRRKRRDDSRSKSRS